MYVRIKKSGLILFSVLFGLLTVGLCGAILCLRSMGETDALARRGEQAAVWRMEVGDLSAALRELETDLRKGLFASGDYQAVSWAARVFSRAGEARMVLEALPLYESRLENTEIFLNQVGEFTLEMARKQMRGENLTESESASLRRLALRAREISEEILTLSEKISDENTGYEGLQQEFSPSAEGEKTVFEGLEDLFAGDDPLVYDGDFSAWYASRTSPWIESLPLAEEESDLLSVAAKALGVSEGELTEIGRYTEPFFIREYGAGDATVAVTERGGIPVGFSRPREVTVSRLTVEQGLNAGRGALRNLGFSDLEAVSWERSEHLLHAVYLSRRAGVLSYGARISVTVALDDGSLLGMDGTEYLISYEAETDYAPSLSADQADDLLREGLSVSAIDLTVLTGGDGKKTLCWQFTVSEIPDGAGGADPSEKALIFVNAHTGVEQEIYLVSEGEDFRILR